MSEDEEKTEQASITYNSPCLCPNINSFFRGKRAARRSLKTAAVKEGWRWSQEVAPRCFVDERTRREVLDKRV